MPCSATQARSIATRTGGIGTERSPSGARDLDSGTSTAAELYERYSAVVQSFFDANGRIAALVDDPELRTGTELINLANRQVSASADLTRLLVLGQLRGDNLDPRSEIPDIGAAVAGYDMLAEEIVAKALGDYRPIAERRLTSSDRLAELRRLVTEALRTGEANITALLAVNQVVSDTGYPAFRDDVAAVLDRKTNALTAAATSRERRYVAVAIAVVVFAAVATWLTARSITRPITSLTRQATAIAGERLPRVLDDIVRRPLGQDVELVTLSPVDIATRDEVNDVAGALTNVQETALDLAFEQAILRRNLADAFVNLGRRNQNLLNRQLDFITELERHEPDPEALSHLFELDHLATRMRRNAESLLVLAGVEQPRTWSAPIPVSDIVRSALGEVDAYRRVRVHVAPADIAGQAATDLAHLIAELVENALTFSAATEPVEVRGIVRGSGYGLVVVDRGLGMTPPDVEQANRRLGGAESFTVAPSRYLGHYVAGHLAARHGVALRLDSTFGDGTVASIALPAELVVLPSTTFDRGGTLAPARGHATFR